MIVVRMIAIQTFMILYPSVTSHSRPPIARLGLLLCFLSRMAASWASPRAMRKQPIPSYASTSPFGTGAPARLSIPMVRDARDWDLLTRPDGLSCSRSKGAIFTCLETFIPLSPSCRAIVQVEKRSLRSRCLMPFFGVKPPPPPCSRRPHRTFVPLSPLCKAGSFKSRRARCALMVLDAILWRRRHCAAVLSPST
jgi:hypothetical protein